MEFRSVVLSNLQITPEPDCLGFYLFDTDDEEIGLIEDLMVDEKGFVKLIVINIASVAHLEGKADTKRYIPYEVFERFTANSFKLNIRIMDLFSIPIPSNPDRISDSEFELIKEYFGINKQKLAKSQDLPEEGSSYYLDTSHIDIPDDLHMEDDDV